MEEEVPENGHPDNCNGYYAKELPYKKWFELNCSLRTHQNFIESLPKAIVILLACGLRNPKTTLIIGAIACFARPFLYNKRYMEGGPNKRLIGMLLGAALMNFLGLITTCQYVGS